ncbi:MAG: ribokinase, partial [Pseudomonadota bacterium]
MPESMGYIVNLGVFVADTAYRADRAPRLGETILGNSFALGPGGKGSNQAVAAARLGADVRFVSRLGQDDFAEMALKTWAEAGVTPVITQTAESYTGAAYIFVEEASGDNAIIICPGAAALISEADVVAQQGMIEGAAVFVTQLEQPLEAAMAGLRIARGAGVTTVLNPAPAAALPEGMLALCDYLTPNETEAEDLTGLPVQSLEEARAAAEALRALGVGTAIITLGERGALFHSGAVSELVPAMSVGPVVETTGAGDAFNGGLCAGLAAGMAPLEAVRMGCAV